VSDWRQRESTTWLAAAAAAIPFWRLAFGGITVGASPSVDSSSSRKRLVAMASSDAMGGRKEGRSTRQRASNDTKTSLSSLWFATGSALLLLPIDTRWFRRDRHKCLSPEALGGLGRVDEAVLVHFFHACPRARSLATPFSEQKRGGVWRAVWWCGGVRRGKKGRDGAGMERSRVRMRRGQGAEEGRARRWQ